jgi:hypothetical protein
MLMSTVHAGNVLDEIRLWIVQASIRCRKRILPAVRDLRSVPLPVVPAVFRPNPIHCFLVEIVELFRIPAFQGHVCTERDFVPFRIHAGRYDIFEQIVVIYCFVQRRRISRSSHYLASGLPALAFIRYCWVERRYVPSGFSGL